MANQLAIRVLARRSSTVIAGRRQHVVAYEDGAAAENSGVQFHTLPDEDGTISPAGIRWAIEAAQPSHAEALSRVRREHSHGGVRDALAPSRPEAVVQAAGDLPVYMDGARLFNAEVATGVPAAEHASGMTAVMCCISKGLCAPVGSLLAGATDMIAEARNHRTAWAERCARQASSPPLASSPSRRWWSAWREDHARARGWPSAVAARWPDAGCDPGAVRTNIVVFTHSDPPKLLAHLMPTGSSPGRSHRTCVRLVTHNDVDDEGLEQALSASRTAP